MERKSKSRFNLRSGNKTAFKYMGSSPVKQRLTDLDIMSKEEEEDTEVKKEELVFPEGFMGMVEGQTAGYNALTEEENIEEEEEEEEEE